MSRDPCRWWDLPHGGSGPGNKSTAKSQVDLLRPHICFLFRVREVFPTTASGLPDVLPRDPLLTVVGGFSIIAFTNSGTEGIFFGRIYLMI